MTFGCRQACDPANSKAVCAAVQECFESHPAAACRERERIAIQVSKPNPALKDAYSGGAEALNTKVLVAIIGLFATFESHQKQMQIFVDISASQRLYHRQ
jgi:hypothetical protein